MQKRVVLVSAAVAALGLAAAVSGFVAEATNPRQAFVVFDGRRCVYRSTPALFCGVAAALLALAGLALATAASGCFGCNTPVAGRRRATVVRLSIVAWVLVSVAAAMFLYGAALNRGGTWDLSTSRRSWRYGRGYYYGCVVLKSGIFSTASILSAAAAACAIAAYVYLHRADDYPAVPGQFAAPGVAMGQPQWSQSYPTPAYPPAPAYQPPPMAYPAPPPYGGYGAKQPAGTA